MTWTSVKDSLPESDTYNKVKLKSGAERVSYYFEDSYGKWWSSDRDIWDRSWTQLVVEWEKVG